MMTTVRILIVGKNTQRACGLLRRLDTRSWDFYFVETCVEVMPLLKEHSFDFVLSQFMLPDGCADQLLAPLRGARTHMFFSHLFENDCVWLHVLEKGQNRWWEPQLIQPHDFLDLIERFIQRDLADKQHPDDVQKLGRSENSSPP